MIIAIATHASNNYRVVIAISFALPTRELWESAYRELQSTQSPKSTDQRKVRWPILPPCIAMEQGNPSNNKTANCEFFGILLSATD